MKIRRATMAVVAAGALVLSACTSDTGTDDNGAAGGDGVEDADTTDDGTEDEDQTADDEEAGEEDTSRADLGDVTTNDDMVSFSTGAEEYNAYNGDTGGTNSTYNAVVNAQLQSGFWYYGTDATVYPNEWFGSYEMTSEDPLTVEYTISDEAVWSDGTPVTSNDYLLYWASTNPDALGGVDTLGFDPVSTWSAYALEAPQAEAGSKEFTVVYEDPYPDWELAATATMPSHIVAEQSGLEPDELAQAVIDGDGETVAQVAEFWNEGWLFPNYQVEDESIVPSSGPYTLQGASWQQGTSLTLAPNEEFWGPAPATGNLMFRFAAPETHVQALSNGDINVIEPQATVDTVQQIENIGEEVTLDVDDSLTWEHLDYNFGEGSPFADDAGGLAAREAFAYCVPRQGIVDSLIAPINPDAVVMNAREYFPFQDDYDQVVSEAYDGRYDQVDLEMAREMFEEAGLEDGQEIRIGYSAPNQRRTEQVDAIKASCDEVGFNIQDAGDAAFFEAGGPLDSGDWEVALFAWAGSGQRASGANIYMTAEGSQGTQNYGGFSNEEVDAAWRTMNTTIDEDVELEQKIIIEKLLWDELYGLPIFAHPNVVGYDSTLENVRPTAAQTGVSWNAEQWVRAE